MSVVPTFFLLFLFTFLFEDLYYSVKEYQCLVQFRIAALMQEPSFVLMTILFVRRSV